MSDDNPKVIVFQGPEYERTHQIRARVEWRANQPEFEWRLYLKDDAAKLELSEAELEKLIKAKVKEREQKTREEQAIQRKHEQKQERETRKKTEEEKRAEREEREEEKREKREKREEAAERRREQREREKREKRMATLMAMPVDERETALRALALELGEDLDGLRKELEQRIEEERERIRRGKVESWPEAVNALALLNDLEAQLKRYLVIHQKEAATVIVLWIAWAWIFRSQRIRLFWSSRLPMLTPGRRQSVR